MRKYNGGDWTPARFHSFVKGALRSASVKWPPKYQSLNDSYVGQKINSKTGRLAKHYKCASCKEEFPSKDVQVDHITPVVDPNLGFTSWDEIIDRMFCEKENLQVLCKICHDNKTKQEREISKHARNVKQKSL